MTDPFFRLDRAIEPGALPVAETVLTLGSRVYDDLRREIIRGNHEPGRKLHIQTLCARFGVGLSPMREALARLSRDGLVRHEDQRGFSVAAIDETHLEELTRTRCWFNEIGLRESITHGDARWEENVLLSYHRLSKLPRYLSEDGTTVVSREWDAAHRVFHTALIAACRSRWLIAYCEQLFDASDFYRHVSRVALQRRGLRPNEHEKIVKATLAREADLAVKLLVAHLRRTADLVREKLAQDR